VKTVTSPPNAASRASTPHDRSRLTRTSTPPPSTSTSSVPRAIGPPPDTTPPTPAIA
jgi:hypothetical protein